MALIRRFEEEAGRQYQRAKAGGFLHLAIGEEATIVGTTSVMRDEDFLIGTYRTHGHAIARGTEPNAVMAEIFGRVDGTSGGRGGSMHIFDAERRFMGGYGIVGGNLPIAAGLALASQYKGEDAVTVCMFGDGASNTGNFGETMNLAALWTLPVLFLVENNLYGMGTAIERHSAQTDLSKKAEGYGDPRDADRRHGRGRGARGGRRGAADGARGGTADADRGRHLPLPRPLRRRPGGLPGARGGRGVARERPDRELRAALRRGGGAGRARGRPGARGGRGGGAGGGRVRRRLAGTGARHDVREPLRADRLPRRLVRGRRAQPGAAPRRARGRHAGAGARAGRGGRRLRRGRGGGRAAEPGGPGRRPGRHRVADRARPGGARGRARRAAREAATTTEERED